MRKHWDHHASDTTQPTPEDNGSADVEAQVGVWVSTGVLIHAEIAMEIAAWWHAPRSEGFTPFSHKGTVTPELVPEIRSEIKWLAADSTEDSEAIRTNIRDLCALWAYVDGATPC